MNKYRYLFKNIGLLTLSNFGTKILSFFLVPLYTNVLTTTEYGSYDLLNTTVLLLIPILTLNIFEAVIRFSMDSYDKEDVFSVGLQIILKGIFILILLLFLNNICNFIPIIKNYYVSFFLMYVTSAMYQLLSQFARGLDNILELSIAGVINSVTILVLNVFFLAYLRLGINGFLLANILGTLIPSIYLCFNLKIFKYINFKKMPVNLSQEMKNYSKPLILNSISWWINNASDRYIIIWLCGVASNGVYSVAYKIPSILNIFQNIFLQAWQLSAIRAFNRNDENGFFVNIYNSYNFLMIIVCSLLIVFTKFIAKILYANNFYSAWVYVPMLLISIVFGSMSGFIGGVFSAVKDTKIYSVSTTIGAVFNIVCNIVLVFFWGPIGAAISTALSYFLIWAIRIVNVKKYMSLKLNIKRDLLAYLILILQSMMIFTKLEYLHMYNLLLTFVICILYYKELSNYYSKGILMVNGRKN